MSYNPAEVERLIAEARPGAFDVNELTSWSIDCLEHFPVTAPAATRILRRLVTMADQLEAADAEIVSLRDERDVACTEAGRLRAQNRSLCEALAAAQAGMHDAKQRCRTMGEITDEALGLLFGLLTNTGPDRMSINGRRVLIQVAERLQRVQREISK